MSDPATAFTTVSLIDFCIGIVGNLVARHGDPAFESLAVIIRERIGKGGLALPPNHDVERACRESLQQALKMLAQAMELRIHRPKTWIEAFRNRHDETGRTKPVIEWKRTAEGTWFDEFECEIQLEESLKLFRLPISDASSLNSPVRNQPDKDLEKLFHNTLLDWAERRVQNGTPPACFQEFVSQGWPVKADSPGVRITLYQAWCLFLQDKIKHDPEVFRALTTDWLAKIDSRLASVSVRGNDLLDAVQQQLGEQREILMGLRDDVSKLLTEVGKVGISLGELLALVAVFRDEVGQGFHELRTELIAVRDQLAAIQQTQWTSLANDEQILDKLDEVLDRTSSTSGPIAAVRLLAPRVADGLLRAEKEHFYGRKKQIRQLQERLQERLDTAVVGPAGFGKTALAARVVLEVVGRTSDAVASSPYPDGVLFLDLYSLHGQAEQAWHQLANDLCGPEFLPTRQARERARGAVQNRRLLLVIEGGEEADGKNGRVSLPELLDVLSPENRRLLLTREKTQANPQEVLSLDEPLNDQDAGRLFDRLTGKRVAGAIRERILKLLAGHPLGLTWAGGLLARADEDPAVLAAEWESDPTLTLSDPDPLRSKHTLAWLYGRSTRGLDGTARTVLTAAGMLAHRLFPVAAVEHVFNVLEPAQRGQKSAEAEHVGNVFHVRTAIKQLVDAGLLRRNQDQPQWCDFTHVLGYEFARKEASSADDLRRSLAEWLHQRLSAELQAGVGPTGELNALLEHAAAMLRTDHDQQLYWTLANFLLYAGRDRLVSLGRLDWVNTALAAVEDWLDRFPTKKSTEEFWQRERSVCFNRLGVLATAQGNLPEAQRLFGESLRIAQRLAESDPANAAWQRDLSVSFNWLGNLARAQGNLPEAQRLFGEALRIAQRLAESDPANAAWQRDLAQSHCWIGNVLVAQGELMKARESYDNYRRTRQRLAESDPANAAWQRDLSVSFNKLGDLATAQGNLPEAQRLFGESLRIAQRLAESDPANAEWQRDLWVSFWRVANALEQQGSEEATSYWRQAHATLTAMVASDLFVSPQDMQFLDRLRAKVSQQ